MKWTPEEDQKLRDLASDGLSPTLIANILPERTADAIWARASRLKIRLQSQETRSAYEYLKEGGAVVRDEIGGVVGVRWGAATRTGETFATRFCERLVALGFIRPLSERANVFQWRDAA